MTLKQADREMSFLDHLEELRRRIFKCVLAAAIFSIAAYFISEHLVDIVTAPLHDYGVYFKSPTEAFMVRFKMSIFAGLVAAMPVIFYQLWMFVGPALYRTELRVVIPVIFSATVFFLVGGGFCFFYIIPLAVRFLLGFATENLKPMIMVGEYISFVSMMVLAFGLVFELPVAAFILGRMGVVDHRMLAKGRRYAIIIILIAAAVLTPTPDMISQLLLAGPLYFLYEVSIVVVWLTGRKRAA
jgi:sec-independent protein translocase protein TatC